MRRHDDAAAVDLPQRRPRRRANPTTSSCGTRWSAARAASAGSGPRLLTVIWIRMSSGRRLRVLDEHVEVAIAIEHARVEQLVLELMASTVAVGVDEIVVRKGRLRVLVQVLHVRVGRRRVEVEVVLLHVLAVIALAVGQAEEALLEDGILAVPQRHREAQQLPGRPRCRRGRLRPSGRLASAPDRG